MNQVIFKDHTGHTTFHDDLYSCDFKDIRLLGPSYFISVPISKMNFRHENACIFGDKSSVECIIDAEYHNFKITDDWGNNYTISIPNEMDYEIRHAVGLSKIKHDITVLFKYKINSNP